MRTPLATLLHENPFTILGVPLTASPREIRHRLDELEMETALGGGITDDRAALIRSSHTLDDPLRRIECEWFVPWDGATPYGEVADDHDAALKATLAAFDRSTENGAAEGLSALHSWIATLHDPAVGVAIDQRSRQLGVDLTSNWIAETIGENIVPALLTRTFELTGPRDTLVAESGQVIPPGDQSHQGFYTEAATVITRLSSRHIEVCADLLAANLEEAVESSELIDSLKVSQVQRALSQVNEASRLLRETAPNAARRMLSSIAEAANISAIHRFNAGNLADSASLLTALLACDLAESDRIKPAADLLEMQNRIAWDRAVEHIEYGEWQEAIAALDQVISLSTDIEVRTRAREYWRLAHQAKAQGRRGQRQRPSGSTATAQSAIGKGTTQTVSNTAEPPVFQAPTYALARGSANGRPRRWGVWLWVTAAALVGACAILVNVNSGDEDDSGSRAPTPQSTSRPSSPAPSVRTSPRPTSAPTSIPPTPRPVQRPTFFVNSDPVGCHTNPATNAEITVHRPPGAIHAVDALINQADDTWHREVDRQCWILTRPGPVLEFSTLAEAEQYALAVRRRRFSADVNPHLQALRVSGDAAESMSVTSYAQAAQNIPFAEAAERAAADANKLNETAKNATFGDEFLECRDALASRAQTEERFWSDLAAAARFSNSARWNNAAASVITVNAAILTVVERCSGVLTA